MIQAARATDSRQSPSNAHAMALSGCIIIKQQRIGSKMQIPRVEMVRNTYSHWKTSMPQPSELSLAHFNTKKKMKNRHKPMNAAIPKAMQREPISGFGKPFSMSLSTATLFS